MSAHDTIERVAAIPAPSTKILANACAESGGGMTASASVAVARFRRARPLGSGWRRRSRKAGRSTIGCQRFRCRQGRRIPDARRAPPRSSLSDDGERPVCAFNDPKLVPDAASLPLDRIGAFDTVLADVRWPQGAATVRTAPPRRPARVLDGDVGPREVLIDLARARDPRTHSWHGPFMPALGGDRNR